MLAAERLRPQATGTLNVYFYTAIRLSSTVTFPTLPGFSVTLPTKINPAGLQFFYAISNPKPTDGAEAQFRSEGPATVSGQNVTFAPSTTPLTLQADQPYTIAFYAISPIAATPRAGILFVANQGNNLRNVTVIDTAHDNAALPSITSYDLSSPEGVAVDATGKLYVTSAQYDNVSEVFVFDTVHGNAELTPITGGGLVRPSGLALDAHGKLYAANTNGGNVCVFDIAHGNTALPAITGGGLTYPVGVAVGADGKLYVANIVFSDFDRVVISQVLVFDTVHGNAPLPPVTTNSAGNLGGTFGFSGLAIDSSGKLYLTNGLNTVLVFDTAHGNAVLPPITSSSFDTLGLALDASGKLYVASGSPPYVAGSNRVNVFDTRHANAALPPITSAVDYPQGLAISQP
jgi:DNA-binding beta-propeller fold protein YncE